MFSSLDPETMRELGYRVVDLVVDHAATLRDRPALTETPPAELLDRIGGPVPERPGDLRGALDVVADVITASMQHGEHPRYFARVPGPAAFPAILGDWLGTGTQAMAASWGGGSGPTAAELVSLGWLAECLGLPSHAEGIMTSGGSIANLTVLLAARAAQGPGAVYASDQVHSSILRNLRVTGEQQVRVLRSDECLRLPLDGLRHAIARDRAAGIAPTIVVATAGTTNTGAVDPIPDLAALCRSEGMWLHVDGAYGAPAALCPDGQAVLAGLELADSLVVDPHKWLFQPYDIACAYVMRPGVLEQTFTMNPEYLADVTASQGEVDLRNRGLELSRRARGIKLWLTFVAYGRPALAEAVERGIRLAEYAEAAVRRDAFWEVVTPAQLGIVTFAAVGRTGDDMATAARDLTRDGYAALTTTSLHDRAALRLCVINPDTTPDDIDGTLMRLRALLADAPRAG